jgi:four helix bundle protein
MQIPNTFSDLKVWHKSHSFVLDIYCITKKFPLDERFGLTSQLRRSASAIPANIVEGNKRKSKKEFMHFLDIADASLEETKYHILLSRDIGYINSEEYERLSGKTNEIGRMINGLMASTKKLCKGI